MARSPSPPGRFSITTALPPQRAGNRSDRSRAPMSAPAPGPNGTISRTGRCGQLCACSCDGIASSIRPARVATVVIRAVIWRMPRPPHLLLRTFGRPVVKRLALRGCLMNGRNLGALLFDRGGEFLRRALARRSTDALGPRAECRISHDGGDVGGDPALNLRSHVARPVKADRAFECEVGVALLARGRDLGRLRGALAIGDEQERCGAGAVVRYQRRHAGCGEMQSPLIEVLIRGREVAIGDFNNVEAS